jgi:hypothetical protein
VLPQLSIPDNPVSDSFDAYSLVGSVQRGADCNTLRNYLTRYNQNHVQAHVNDEVAYCPPLFYALATNSEDIVRLFIDHGADVNRVHGPSGTPPIAFALIHGEKTKSDTTAIVATLLGLGASPLAIPSDLYTPFTRYHLLEPTEEHMDSEESEDSDGEEREDDQQSAWCTSEARAALRRSMNITQRYYLERASKAKRPTKRRRQIARLRNAEPVLGISYFLIGQRIAADWLTQRLIAHLAIPSRRSLVLCFAGPSGHGKTELARQLGHLLYLDLQVVDCTIYRREPELFGPRTPYHGSDQGSPLNNFLEAHSGRRSIVFFDEFDKTTPDIQEALLIPFGNGKACAQRRDNDTR